MSPQCRQYNPSYHCLKEQTEQTQKETQTPNVQKCEMFEAALFLETCIQSQHCTFKEFLRKLFQLVLHWSVATKRTHKEKKHDFESQVLCAAYISGIFFWDPGVSRTASSRTWTEWMPCLPNSLAMDCDKARRACFPQANWAVPLPPRKADVASQPFLVNWTPLDSNTIYFDVCSTSAVPETPTAPHSYNIHHAKCHDKSLNGQDTDEKIKVPFFFTLKSPEPSDANIPGSTACEQSRAPTHEASNELLKVSGSMSRIGMPNPPPPQL